PALALPDDSAHELPDFLGGLEVIPTIARQVDQADEAPTLELAQAVAHVRSRDVELLDDLLGVHRSPGDEEQRVDLRHRAVHAPARAHLAPVEDEPGQ